MSKPYEYCGSTPIQLIVRASNLRGKPDESAEEIMRANYVERLHKLMYSDNPRGISAAGGGIYIYPDYSRVKEVPKHNNPYNTISNVYKNYTIKPCFL